MEKKASSWRTNAARGRGAATPGAPATVAATRPVAFTPGAAANWPANTCRSVVLPPPEGPIMAVSRPARAAPDTRINAFLLPALLPRPAGTVTVTPSNTMSTGPVWARSAADGNDGGGLPPRRADRPRRKETPAARAARGRLWAGDAMAAAPWRREEGGGEGLAGGRRRPARRPPCR